MHGAPSGQEMARERDPSFLSEEQIEGMQSWTVERVGQWMHGLGLGECAAAFQAHVITGDLLPLLTEPDLIQMGIVTVGPRKRMIKALLTIKKAHRAFTRHKVQWRADEDMSRGSCFRGCAVSLCPLCFDKPSRYKLTGTLLSITHYKRGCCCGLFSTGKEMFNNNISLKEVTDVDTDEMNNICGVERRVSVAVADGEGSTASGTQEVSLSRVRLPRTPDATAARRRTHADHRRDMLTQLCLVYPSSLASVHHLRRRQGAEHVGERRAPHPIRSGGREGGGQRGRYAPLSAERASRSPNSRCATRGWGRGGLYCFCETRENDDNAQRTAEAES